MSASEMSEPDSRGIAHLALATVLDLTARLLALSYDSTGLPRATR
jgi:hypothetical protein